MIGYLDVVCSQLVGLLFFARSIVTLMLFDSMIGFFDDLCSN